MGTGNTRLPLQLYAASHRASCHWDRPEKAARTALTREPGDLPVAVVFRPARVRRTDGYYPERRHRFALRGGRRRVPSALARGGIDCPKG